MFLDPLMPSSDIPRSFWIFSLLLLGVILLILFMQFLTPRPQLLTDPFLQLPTETSVKVVWFTEFLGSHHQVNYGENLSQMVTATTTQLSKTREDQDSKIGEKTAKDLINQPPKNRNIWRHEAEVKGLTPGVRLPYQVTSVREEGQTAKSAIFTLASKALPGMQQNILLTSDHQLMPMVAANLQKVAETVGKVDAIFFAGDLVNIPDRASEWFDDHRGNGFFPCLQGRANYPLKKQGITTLYTGGELMQHAPLFPTLGNHEIMGQFSREQSLNQQFRDSSVPRAIAEKFYHQQASEINPNHDPNVRQAWIKNHSFNSDTYQEIFTLPQPEKYYAITLGDVRLISLYITNIWRQPSLDPDVKGKYRERSADFHQPQKWGYGQYIFEPISPGSVQYNWLVKELKSAEFQQARYKIVMFHHPAHSLGENIVPAYTDPVQMIDFDQQGKIKMVRYEYPKSHDYIIRDVVPLLESAGVQLVLYGHSHLWNRFQSSSGMNFLETSNVGNSYGAFVGETQRRVPLGFQDDAAMGNPHGLEPIIPTIAPLRGDNGEFLPYIASNDLTVFSILETAQGVVSSYYFDTRQPESKVIKFDEFFLNP